MKYRPLTFVFADEDDMLRVLLLRRVLLVLGLLSRTTHDAMLHSALWCCAPGLERIQHSVHSKSLALKCTEHSVLSK